MKNIGIDKKIYNMPKEEAFKTLYNKRYPKNWYIEEDYQYYISTNSLSDKRYCIFGVSNGKKGRILASKLIYIKEESRDNLENIKISETYITIKALNKIIRELKVF